MSDEAQKQPMLETILKEVRDGFATVNRRMNVQEQRLESIESLVNRAAGVAYDTCAEVREIKADLKKLREQLNIPV